MLWAVLASVHIGVCYFPHLEIVFRANAWDAMDIIISSIAIVDGVASITVVDSRQNSPTGFVV